ncbi:hypothetical protein RUM43_003863 [Polyplax serrata]|uniref:Uncharacterized protein n=1 Tax=Polyplax serrata TaxID=468196 RepID=A0AAN8S906_POLSC
MENKTEEYMSERNVKESVNARRGSEMKTNFGNIRFFTFQAQVYAGKRIFPVLLLVLLQGAARMLQTADKPWHGDQLTRVVQKVFSRKFTPSLHLKGKDHSI